MADTWPLRFGAFISPIHSPDENPTLAIHRDVALISQLDTLGYDEAWMGEHHSTGWEYVASPEVFLAFAAARTSRIKLGTGVVSLPYHHPFNVAERAVLLDHLLRGRFIFGVGPGALAYDAKLFGLHSNELRPMMEESLEVILALLRGERISRRTDWFDLVDAQLQLLPFSQPCFEVAVTCTVSPSGAKLAGQHGLSMLSLTATQTAGIGALSAHWTIVEEQAARHGTKVDRRNWRMVGPMHIAETREQARQEVRTGLSRWIYYNTKVGTLGLVPDTATTTDSQIDALIESGFAVIGTPDDAEAQIERLWKSSGGFGTFLFWSHDWANREATHRSYELFAQEVIPRFQNQTATLRESQAYALRHRSVLAPQAMNARQIARDQYNNEKANTRDSAKAKQPVPGETP